jgi:hypothetical protein
MPTSTHSTHDTPSIDLEEINSHWPPVADFSTETPSQRDERLQHEREAKRINDEIDAQIEIEKSERRKRRPDIRIILLGACSSPTFLFIFIKISLPHRFSHSPTHSYYFLFIFRDVSPIQARPSQVNQPSCATFNSNMHLPLSMLRQQHGEPSSTSTSYVPSHSCSTSSRKVAPPAPPVPPVPSLAPARLMPLVPVAALAVAELRT